MSESYEDYCVRLGGLNVDPLPRDAWARAEERMAWWRRISDASSVLDDEEVEKLMVELRDRNASHKKYLVTLYAWAANCPHDTDHLEDEQPYYVGDGPEHPDEDERHKRDEDGELFCVLSPVGEECMCGDGYCQRLSELNAAAEDFWFMVERSVAA